MGTRCLTIILDGSDILYNIYRQFDGYPEGHGVEIAKFLKDYRLVNGLGMKDVKVFNGMGCLAAAVVAELKDGPGGIYLYPPRARDVGEEFIYEIFIVNGTVTMKVRDMWYDKLIFTGKPADFYVEFKREVPDVG